MLPSPGVNRAARVLRSLAHAPRGLPATHCSSRTALCSPRCSSSSVSSSSRISSSTSSALRSSSLRSASAPTSSALSLSSARFVSFTSPTSQSSTPRPTPESAERTQLRPDASQQLGEGTSEATPASDSEAAALSAPESDRGPQVLGQIEPRLQITFTCTVPDCGTRSSHEFTKRSYERGIVLVECPGCKNRHLIADNLGWFKESTEDGKLRTIEDLMRAKGEKVRRGYIDGQGGTVEFTPDS